MASAEHQQRNRMLGARIVHALEERQFAAYYCETKEEALALAQSMIPQEDMVAWGGSATVSQIGLLDWVKTNRQVIDRDTAKTPEERTQLMRRALLCDTYLTSTNALTYHGQLVNIDGNGNRVAAMLYGPKKVLIIAGLNKAVPDLESAILRARNEAAPLNKQRFGGTTPCLQLGHCGDCNASDCICNYMTIIRRCNPPKKISVLLVGETLGF